jgi:AraC family transcriptional regulator, transcriptional activator FtrA
MPSNIKIMPNTFLSNQIPNQGPKVAVLVYDGLCTFEFAVAYEVFGLPRPEMGASWYRFLPVAIENGPLRAAGGLTLVAADDVAALSDADLVIVPGWRGIDQPVPPALIAALQQVVARGASCASLCSGVFVLAAAGLLDGHRATTHWRYAEALAARHKAITVLPDVLYVDNGQVLTAAGSAAAIDLCLHIVRRDFGVEAANKVARRLVVPPHRDGGQAQFIERPVPVAYESQRLAGLLDWMRTHLAQPLPLVELASRAGLSLRTFQRRFEEMTGLSPGLWLIRERVALARLLIETRGDLTLEAIAHSCGFASTAILRHHFQKEFGTSPARYRRLFAPG